MADRWHEVRTEDFRLRILIAVASILAASTMFLALRRFFPALTGGVGWSPTVVVGVVELTILALSRRTSSLAALQVFAYLVVAIVVALFAWHGVTDVSFFILTAFLGGMIFSWIPLAAAGTIATPLAAFCVLRTHAGGIQSLLGPDALIFILTAVVITSIQFSREWRSRIEFISTVRAETAEADLRRGLSLAARLHADLISEDIRTSGADIRIHYDPTQCLGGDYVRVGEIADGRLAMVLADVTGHGVAAALMVNRFDAEVQRLLRAGESPDKSARELNRKVLELFNGTGMLTTAVWVEHDRTASRVRWAGFGHPPGLRVRPGSASVDILSGHYPPMGITLELAERPDGEIEVVPGDILIYYTDGLMELMENGVPLQVEGLRRYAESFARFGDRTASDFLEAFRSLAGRLKQSPASDDIIIVAWEVLAPAG